MSGELRQLWLEPRDPRLLQLGFSLLYLLDIALRAVAQPQPDLVGELAALALEDVVEIGHHQRPAVAIDRREQAEETGHHHRRLLRSFQLVER